MRAEDPVSHMHLSAPSSVQETVDWHPVEASADPDVGVHEETVLVPASRFVPPPPPSADPQRVMRVRGVDMAPSGDLPNIPTRTPPTRAVSPKIRHDMFRRKESPGSGGSGGSK